MSQAALSNAQSSLANVLLRATALLSGWPSARCAGPGNVQLLWCRLCSMYWNEIFTMYAHSQNHWFLTWLLKKVCQKRGAREHLSFSVKQKARSGVKRKVVSEPQ